MLHECCLPAAIDQLDSLQLTRDRIMTHLVKQTVVAQLMLAGVEVRALEIVMVASELLLWWSIRQCDVSVPFTKQ